MQTKFFYHKSKPISYRNCLFDSRAEFKFALSIEDEHRFLREYVAIWYDPRTNLPVPKHPVMYLPEDSRKYSPDFLIRHVQTGKASLVEVKPSAYSDDGWLQKKVAMAEAYISRQNLDWEFKVVFDNEIFLTKEKWAIYQAVFDRQKGFEMLREMQRQDKKYSTRAVKYFNQVPAFRKGETLATEEYIRFVKYGGGSLKEMCSYEQNAHG
jgi:hypothetical protein